MNPTRVNHVHYLYLFMTCSFTYCYARLNTGNIFHINLSGIYVETVTHMKKEITKRNQTCVYQAAASSISNWTHLRAVNSEKEKNICSVIDQ